MMNWRGGERRKVEESGRSIVVQSSVILLSHDLWVHGICIWSFGLWVSSTTCLATSIPTQKYLTM